MGRGLEIGGDGGVDVRDVGGGGGGLRGRIVRRRDGLVGV